MDLSHGEGAAAAEGVFLSDRERQIVTLLIQGFKDGEIAATMSVDVQTIKQCFRNIQRKLCVSDRLELVFSAVHRNILLTPPRGSQRDSVGEYRRPAPAA